MNRSAITRKLMSRTRIVDGHYLWGGAINSDGYGSLWIDGKSEKAHRLSAYVYHNLDLNDKTQHALHKITCPYKNCWAKDCIYVGTHTDNMRDIWITPDSDLIYRCGHPRTEDNTYVMEDRKRCKTCYTRYDRRRRARERNRKRIQLNQTQSSKLTS